MNLSIIKRQPEITVYDVDKYFEKGKGTFINKFK